MVRRSRYRRRRRRGYKGYGRKFFSTAGKALATASSALAIAKGVKQLVNVEYKVHEVESANFNIDTTGSTDCLSLIAEGDDNTQRNGRSIKCTSMYVRGKVYFNAAGTVYQRGRLIILQDMHGNGGSVGLSDVLTTGNIDDFLNLDNTDRFKIWLNKEYIVTAERPVIMFKKFIKRNSKLEYIGTSDNIASTGAGSFWFLTIGNIASGSNPPTMSYHARMRFIDN